MRNHKNVMVLYQVIFLYTIFMNILQILSTPQVQSTLLTLQHINTVQSYLFIITFPIPWTQESNQDKATLT